MCSDLAIRSGTAAAMTPAHYDAARHVLTFRTKYDNAQELPVTGELRELLDTPGLDPGVPFVAQLPRGFEWRTGRTLMGLGRMEHSSLHNAWGKLKRRLGLRPALRPHDLRRTTVRRVYDATRDLRLAQALLGHSDLTSTLWYLQGDQVPVEVSTLELAKLNPLTERPQ